MLKTTIPQAVLYQPAMGRPVASTCKKRIPRCQTMIDDQTTVERHNVISALRALQNQLIRSMHTRHPYALKLTQVLGAPHRTVATQPFGGYDQHTLALAKGAQFHRAIAQGAKTNGDIDAVTHQINTLVRQTEFHPDPWVLVLKSIDEMTDMQNTQRTGTGNTHRSGRCLSCIVHFLTCLLDEGKNLHALRIISRPFVC
ncbi:hypothetical protein HK20_12950 [Acetobacter sp. DsW_54]|nr:hypothetical protein HK20_12950 [Acetobacter sp. DsW_54]